MVGLQQDSQLYSYLQDSYSCHSAHLGLWIFNSQTTLKNFGSRQHLELILSKITSKRSLDHSLESIPFGLRQLKDRMKILISSRRDISSYFIIYKWLLNQPILRSMALVTRLMTFATNLLLVRDVSSLLLWSTGKLILPVSKTQMWNSLQHAWLTKTPLIVFVLIELECLFFNMQFLVVSIVLSQKLMIALNVKSKLLDFRLHSYCITMITQLRQQKHGKKMCL